MGYWGICCANVNARGARGDVLCFCSVRSAIDFSELNGAGARPAWSVN